MRRLSIFIGLCLPVSAQMPIPGPFATGGGSVACAQLPALTGAVTTSAGSCATTLAPISTIATSLAIGGATIGSNALAVTGTAIISGNVGIGTTPTSLLHSAGSFAAGYVAKTATYTATISDYTINCTANTFTVTLPTAVGITGRIYIVKNSGVGVITVDGDGSETIDGAATVVLGTQYESLTVMSTGASWIIQ